MSKSWSESVLKGERERSGGWARVEAVESEGAQGELELSARSLSPFFPSSAALLDLCPVLCCLTR